MTIRPEQFTCAARIQRERGHAKRQYTDEKGCVCMAQAMNLARAHLKISDDDHGEARLFLIDKVLSPDSDTVLSIIDFNDRADTTVEIAAATLERAAEMARASA